MNFSHIKTLGISRNRTIVLKDCKDQIKNKQTMFDKDKFSFLKDSASSTTSKQAKVNRY